MSSVKPDEAVERSAAAESLGEHEVDVAVLGVPEDDAVVVAVPGEQAGQPFAGVQQRRHRDDDVLQQRGRARRPGPGDGRVEALAGVPQPRRAPVGSAVSSAGPVTGSERQHRVRGRAEVGDRGGRVGLVLDQQRGVPVDDDPPQALVGLRVGLPDPQRGGVEQLDGGRPGLDQGGQRTRCRR